MPWQRVRTNQGKFFTPRATREYEEMVAWACRATRDRIGDVPCDVEIELYEDRAVVILTPRPDAKKRKLKGDVDNYAKAILDGLQKGQMLEDDRQVNELRLTFPPPSE